LEITDLIIVHKADGENVRQAKRAVSEYKNLLHFLQPATPGWQSSVLAVSSLENRGHREAWELIKTFQNKLQTTNYWTQRREEQIKNWFYDKVHDRLIAHFFQNKTKKEQMSTLEEKILEGNLSVTAAVDKLFEDYS